MLITDLGFSKGIIFETVVSTYDKAGNPDAAPMGVVMEDEQTLRLKIFNTSKTLQNLRENRCATVNLTNSVETFYRTAFKEANFNGKLPPEWFEKSAGINAPKLRTADAAIDVSVAKMDALDDERALVLCEVVAVSATKRLPQVYCRAMSLTLEAIIHATRIKAHVNKPDQQENVERLLEIIQNNRSIVNRVAPDSAYSSVMADLADRIDAWRSRP